MINTVSIPPFFVAKFMGDIIKLSNGCWDFNKGKDKDGYSYCTIDRKKFRAHRVSYTLFNGEIKPYYVLDHECRNRYCVNPDHLREVLSKLNVLENSKGVAYNNSIKEFCNEGHSLSGENLRMYNGKRICRTCKRIVALKCYHNKRKEDAKS